MGLFNIFKKKEPLTEEQMKLDYLWEMWRQEQVSAPYNALMTYDNEMNNGGHTRFFLNIAYWGSVEKAVNNLCENLPDVLKENLKTAYSHYLVLIDEENDETEKKIYECDKFFYDNEHLLTDMFQQYANETIES